MRHAHNGCSPDPDTDLMSHSPDQLTGALPFLPVKAAHSICSLSLTPYGKVLFLFYAFDIMYFPTK